jgi:hypothetical protein
MRTGKPADAIPRHRRADGAEIDEADALHVLLSSGAEAATRTGAGGSGAHQ